MLNRHCLAVGVAVLVASGLPGAVRAQSVALANGATLDYDGLDFAVSSCSYTLNGATQSSCPSGETLNVVSAVGGATLEVEGTQGAGANSVLSIAAGSPINSSASLSFTLTAIAPKVHTTVSSATYSTTGTYGAGAAADSGTFNLTANSVTLPQQIAVAGAAPVSNTFTAYNPSSVSNQLSLNVDLVVGNGSSTPTFLTTLNTASLAFAPAPEPASIALVSAGLLGLAVVRRQSRSRLQAQR